MAVTEVDEYARKVLAFAENCSVRAGEACDSVTRGRHKAQDAAGAMTRIRDTAADVTGVMEALDKIAFQTRVLAMNAAVEAGTAGEAGRGFAVVADLVAQLAGRAEEEAARARQQLTALAGELGEAASGVLEVEREFDGIVDHVGTVSDLLAALAGDTREQADIIAEVSAAMQRMNDSVQSNAALMDNSAAFAAALMREADQMVEKAAAFKWDRRCRDVPVTIDRRARSGDGTAGAGEPAGAAAGADPVLQTA